MQYKSLEGVVMATVSKSMNKSGTYCYLVGSAQTNGKSQIVKQMCLGSAGFIEIGMDLLSSGESVSNLEPVRVYEFSEVRAIWGNIQRILRQIQFACASRLNGFVYMQSPL